MIGCCGQLATAIRVRRGPESARAVYILPPACSTCRIPPAIGRERGNHLGPLCLRDLWGESAGLPVVALLFWREPVSSPRRPEKRGRSHQGFSHACDWAGVG